MAKVKTIKLKGNDYAQVSERIKQFREECPRGLIETTPVTQEDGNILFKARILKDKKDPNSAEGVGHALGIKKGEKEFEKLETIAVGRALAMLGYMASGEVASSEEMDEFNAYKDQKVEETIGHIKNLDDVESLKHYFLSLGAMMSDERVIKAKDERKAELTKGDAKDENSTDSAE